MSATGEGEGWERASQGMGCLGWVLNHELEFAIGVDGGEGNEHSKQRKQCLFPTLSLKA